MSVREPSSELRFHPPVVLVSIFSARLGASVDKEGGYCVEVWGRLPTEGESQVARQIWVSPVVHHPNGRTVRWNAHTVLPFTTSEWENADLEIRVVFCGEDSVESALPLTSSQVVGRVSIHLDRKFSQSAPNWLDLVPCTAANTSAPIKTVRSKRRFSFFGKNKGPEDDNLAPPPPTSPGRLAGKILIAARFLDTGRLHSQLSETENLRKQLKQALEGVDNANRELEEYRTRAAEFMKVQRDKKATEQEFHHLATQFEQTVSKLKEENQSLQNQLQGAQQESVFMSPELMSPLGLLSRARGNSIQSLSGLLAEVPATSTKSQLGADIPAQPTNEPKIEHYLESNPLTPARDPPPAPEAHDGHTPHTATANTPGAGSPAHNTSPTTPSRRSPRAQYHSPTISTLQREAYSRTRAQRNQEAAVAAQESFRNTKSASAKYQQEVQHRAEKYSSSLIASALSDQTTQKQQLEQLRQKRAEAAKERMELRKRLRDIELEESLHITSPRKEVVE